MPIPVIVERPIAVEQDTEGLTQALRALFEESYQRGCIETAVRSADADLRARAIDDMDERKLSPGYYSQAAYLLEIANSIEAGVQYNADQLSRDDVKGLLCVKRARAEFQYDHPACGACGERQDNRFQFACRSCRAKFQRGGD